MTIGRGGFALATGLGGRHFGYSHAMSTITVLGAVGGLHILFLLALIVTKRHDVEARPAPFAGPPTHVRVLLEDPYDPRRIAAPEHMTFLLGNARANSVARVSGAAPRAC